jgi:hypothetical protein
LNVSTENRGGCIFFLGDRANYSYLEGVNVGAGESGGFFESIGRVFVSEVVVFRSFCKSSGTIWIELRFDELSDSSSSSLWSCEVERVNLSENEASSGGSGIEMAGGCEVLIQFVRLISNSGGDVLRLGLGEAGTESYHCLEFCGNSVGTDEGYGLVSIAMDGSFEDCVFRENSHTKLIDRHSISSVEVGVIVVDFRRCIFDSTTITAGSGIRVESNSCAFSPGGEISLDPRYCSPFVTFRPTSELVESRNFQESKMLRPSEVNGGSSVFSSSRDLTGSAVFEDSMTFSATSSLGGGDDGGKGEGGNIFIFVSAGAGALILIVVIIVVVIFCRKGDGGNGQGDEKIANGLLSGSGREGGKDGAGDSDDTSEDGTGKSTTL